MQSIAYRGFLDQTPGVAVRDQRGRVHFADDEGGAWQTLTDADIPRLVLLGRIDVGVTQAEADRAAGGAPQIACDRRQEAA